MRRGNIYYLPDRSIGGGERQEEPAGNSRVLKPNACAAGALLLMGIIAYVAFVLVKVTAPARPPFTGSYSTAKGLHACWSLPDLSELCLNTDSMVRYSFTQNARNLEVLYGEATFAVHPDRRPFDVLSGRLLVRDISTRFDVYRHGTLTTLTVIEGGVKAKASIYQQTHQEFDQAQPGSDWEGAQELHRLQQVEFDENTGVLTERPALTSRGLSQALAWQSGRIDPAGKSLGEVLDEFARFQPVGGFSIPDDLRQIPAPDGVLDATDLTDFLEMLKNVYGIEYIQTRRSDDEPIITLWRPQDTQSHQKRK